MLIRTQTYEEAAATTEDGPIGTERTKELTKLEPQCACRTFLDFPLSHRSDGGSTQGSNRPMESGKDVSRERGWVTTFSTAMRSQTNTERLARPDS